MIKRLLLGAALIAGACGALGCDVIFTLKDPPVPSPNEDFAGCFVGPITNTQGAGELTLVLEAPDVTTHNLVGCLLINNPRIDGMLVGAVLHDRVSEASFAVESTQVGAFVMRVVKSPPDEGEDAQTITATDESGEFPFRRSENMTRCTLTCADLAGPQSFAPMVAP
jgi:hypothetical protein